MEEEFETFDADINNGSLLREVKEMGDEYYEKAQKILTDYKKAKAKGFK